MVNYNPELDTLLNEAIAIWDNELLQIQQVQHQQPPHQPQQHDTILIREHLNIYSTCKLTPNIIDPVHLRRELIKINNFHNKSHYLKIPE